MCHGGRGTRQTAYAITHQMAPFDDRLRLCVNSDDLGLSSGIDAGVELLVRAGVVTSVSALPWPRAFATLRRWRGDALLPSVGLHACLAADRDARLPTLLACLRDAPKLRAAVIGQHDDLCEAWGAPLTHLDAHQHLHLLPPLRRALDHVADQRRVPWVRVPRERGAGLKAVLLRACFLGVASPVAFMGLGLTGRISWEAVDARLDALQASGARRVVWMVHPGRVTSDHPSWDGLRQAREQELDALLQIAERLRARVRLVPMDDLLSPAD